jgi:hypothetical protein
MQLAGQSDLITALGVEALRTGDTVLIPAACPPVAIAPHGDISLLDIHLP